MLNYSELREIQRHEMESSAIVDLPEDFYENIAQLLAQRKKEAFVSKSLLAIKEFENIRKIILSIQAKREEKIVLMALRGENTNFTLPNQEREMLKELSSIVKKSRDLVKGVWDNDESPPAASRRLKILRDIAQYKGLDNVVYGPFKQGDEQSLPNSEVDWLLKSKMAEIL